MIPPLALKTPSRIKLKLPPSDRYSKKSNKITPAKETPKSSVKQTPKSSIKQTPKSSVKQTPKNLPYKSEELNLI